MTTHLRRASDVAIGGRTVIGGKGLARRELVAQALLAVAAGALGAAPSAVLGKARAGRKTVVFLHSLAGSPAHWRLQTAHLRDAAAVSTPFWPGHGGVALPVGAPSFEAVAEALAARLRLPKGRRVVLVGHSAGASVALALAGKLGDTVESLLLVDPSGDMRSEPPEEAKHTDAFLSALRSSAYEETVQSYWRGALRGAKPSTEALVMRDLAAASRDTVIYCMEAFRKFDPSRHLASLRCPVQAIFSPVNGGPGGLPAQHPELPSTFLHDVSHWLHLDAPERFNQLLDRMLGNQTASGFLQVCPRPQNMS